jgi:hypothetical protein
MNERIRELAEQATTIEYGVDNGFDRVTFDKEKFAELIIRECLVLNKKTCEELKADDCVLSGYKTLLNLYMISMRNSIEEHFGVEL